jgi:hypothetical protein
MNKLGLAIVIAADTGMNKAFAGRAVVQDGLCTFMPRRAVGQQMTLGPHQKFMGLAGLV